MKKLSMLTLMCTLFIGCATGEVKFTTDDFKGTTVAKMKLNHYTGACVLEANYTRDFKSGNPDNIVIYGRFHTGTNSQDIKKDGFIKIGETIHKIILSDISSEVQTWTDTSKVADAKEKDGFKKDKTVRSSKVYSATLTLPKEVEKDILSADQLSLRVYFGSEDTTFVIKNEALAKVKGFINAKPAS